MKKIIIAGCFGVDSVCKSVAKSIKGDVKDAIIQVVDNLEAKNVINEQFEPEPFILNNYHKEYFETKIKDFHRNKFIDKPKFNFRKR